MMQRMGGGGMTPEGMSLNLPDSSETVHISSMALLKMLKHVRRYLYLETFVCVFETSYHLHTHTRIQPHTIHLPQNEIIRTRAKTNKLIKTTGKSGYSDGGHGSDARIVRGRVHGTSCGCVCNATEWNGCKCRGS